MAHLRVKNVPESLHDRLRNLAGETNHTLSAVVLSAVERELEAREWRKRMVARPGTDLGMEAATLIAESRALRDRQLGSR